jgi:hypothetical protein
MWSKVGSVGNLGLFVVRLDADGIDRFRTVTPEGQG